MFTLNHDLFDQLLSSVLFKFVISLLCNVLFKFVCSLSPVLIKLLPIIFFLIIFNYIAWMTPLILSVLFIKSILLLDRGWLERGGRAVVIITDAVHSGFLAALLLWWLSIWVRLGSCTNGLPLLDLLFYSLIRSLMAWA